MMPHINTQGCGHRRSVVTVGLDDRPRARDMRWTTRDRDRDGDGEEEMMKDQKRLGVTLTLPSHHSLPMPMPPTERKK
jgi:hypothetical protein